MTEQTAVLQITGLSSGYGEAVVVRDVSLKVGAGEIVALLGKNGMGKSTLLKTVMGYLPVQERAYLSLRRRCNGRTATSYGSPRYFLRPARSSHLPRPDGA